MGTTETKIECQCGSHFKFDLEPVAGHAPRNLSCPSCGGDATAACETFIDFLRGQTTNLPTSGTRALKEIRLECGCGTHLKLDLELGEQQAPRPVNCPSCNIDLTPRANALIRNYASAHALNGEPAVGHQPAVPSQHPRPGHRPHPDRAESQKPKAKPLAHPAGRVRSGTAPWWPGVAGAIGGTLLGALIWYGVVKLAGPNANWLAFLPGALAGLGARFAGRGSPPYQGLAAAGVAVLGSVLMVWPLILAAVDRAALPHIRSAYQKQLVHAKAAVAARDDQETLRFVGETTTNSTVRVVYARLGPSTITPEMVAAWKETELPRLRALVDGSHSCAQFEREHLARAHATMRWEREFFAGFGVLGILFSAAGIVAAIKLGSP